jgi:hypothetical protein
LGFAISVTGFDRIISRLIIIPGLVFAIIRTRGVVRVGAIIRVRAIGGLRAETEVESLC